MAATTKMVERINVMLGELIDEVDALPEMAELWQELRPEIRDAYYLEWRNLMGGLDALHADFVAGALNEPQHEEYRRLVERLRSLAPVIEQLGLNMPAAAPQT